MVFRIRSRQYYDKFGHPCSKSYYVQQQKSFLGIKYWRDVTHTESSWGSGTYNETTFFNTPKEAEKLIAKMRINIPIDKVLDEVYATL